MTISAVIVSSFLALVTISVVIVLIGSLWGPDIVWVVVLYCGYKLNKLRKLLENVPLLALVTISVVVVSLFLASN